MLNFILSIIEAFILFIPGFIANPAAVITGGHFPMDWGKNFLDGKRILGDGKTWTGYFGGSLIGVVAGFVLTGLFLLFGISGSVSYGSTIPSITVALLAMSFGSLTGDVTGSFIKRRIGIQRGGKGSLLDQWPFVLVSFLFLLIFSRGFFMAYYGNIIGALAILIITPPLHRAVNIVGYRMKKKDVPW
ncbi:MAG: CDP-2,3-bis-(O-geranylgeranyl)-sn-glycerol synthase [Candidatus Thermoplasmatota archaeon]|jgi:CDP-2,3-bis-(O-geranylgeranyl)-sn-glycerol synthase|nr:CDP-2,3-bis-(O-geranylgeranyl)-sn-glycerol synthase [Candidatus Thermoplasmatota archaeon]MCL5954713.1 CDP-2,3-bis-(O-geranylgeranyl)-sn-glycerol synthase [Candidatus Thermoplasmatota archaeon]